MKYFLCALCAFFLFSFGAYAQSRSEVTSELQTFAIGANKILVTNDGLFVNVDGNLTIAESISYQGNGVYSVSVYGACRKCGSVTIDGKCQNRNCDGYGPPKD